MPRNSRDWGEGEEGASKDSVTSGDVIAQWRSCFGASWNCRSEVVIPCSSGSPWIKSARTFHQIPCPNPKIFQLSGLGFLGLHCPHTNNGTAAGSASGGVSFSLLDDGKAAGDPNPCLNTSDESQNPRRVWVQRDLEDRPVPWAGDTLWAQKI